MSGGYFGGISNARGRNGLAGTAQSEKTSLGALANRHGRALQALQGRALKGAKGLRVERRAQERERVEADQQHPRQRLVGFAGAEVAQDQIEVMALVEFGQGILHVEEVVVEEASVPPAPMAGMKTSAQPTIRSTHHSTMVWATMTAPT